MTTSPYPLLLVAGIIVSIVLWSRIARRDDRLLVIYIAALVSAFLGAKVVYLAAEGWMFWDAPDRWRIWATGKSILGALLGGYVGVELAKKLVGYREATGDWFAVIAPAGILLGRIGCLLHGCCPGRECAPGRWTITDVHGVARWPAVPVEIGFNVFAVGAALICRRRGIFRGQLFHLYLIAYGLFRFAHELLRATPRVGSGISGYHFAAAAVFGLGAWGYWRRARSSARDDR